jgi:creatinine amidohydrolase
MYFDELTMTEFKNRITDKTVVILPIGAVEEHGKHLPLCTDSIQAEYVAKEAAKKINALILPPIRYGICSSTRNFPGTISLSFETLHSLIKDILSELVRHKIKNVVVLSGHAGKLHMAAIRLAADGIVDKYGINPHGINNKNKHGVNNSNNDMKIMVLSDYDIAYEIKDKDIPKGDGHAGFIETSRVLHIRKDLVKGRGQKTMPNLPEFMILKSPERYFPSGVMGDPTNASRKKGEELDKIIVDKLVKLIKKNFRLK